MKWASRRDGGSSRGRVMCCLHGERGTDVYTVSGALIQHHTANGPSIQRKGIVSGGTRTRDTGRKRFQLWTANVEREYVGRQT